MNRKNRFSASVMLVVALIFLFMSNSYADQKKLLGDYNIYFGNLHSHSKYSDGLGMPKENFIWARSVAKYDFYVLTDHCEYLFPWMWMENGDLADKYTEDGKFVAMRGFEWTNFSVGHINVYDTDQRTSIFSSLDLMMLYTWIEANNGIGQFNHPSEKDFESLKYYESVSYNMALIETGNGDNGNNDNVFLPHYIKALDNGWKVAPTNNQDNHKMATTCHRTAIISKKLTSKDLKDAMRSRRVYSTDDPNMKVVFKCGDVWMGSVVATSNRTLTFTISVVDDEPITRIELISNKGVVVAYKNFMSEAAEYVWNPVVEIKSSAYYFVKVTELNTIDTEAGEKEHVAVTAPIWVRSR